MTVLFLTFQNCQKSLLKRLLLNHAGILPLTDNSQHSDSLRLIVYLVEHMLPRKTDTAHAFTVLQRGLIQSGKFSQPISAAQQAAAKVVSVPQRSMLGYVVEQRLNVFQGRCTPFNAMYHAVFRNVCSDGLQLRRW